MDAKVYDIRRGLRASDVRYVRQHSSKLSPGKFLDLKYGAAEQEPQHRMAIAALIALVVAIPLGICVGLGVNALVKRKK